MSVIKNVQVCVALNGDVWTAARFDHHFLSVHRMSKHKITLKQIWNQIRLHLFLENRYHERKGLVLSKPHVHPFGYCSRFIRQKYSHASECSCSGERLSNELQCPHIKHMFYFWFPFLLQWSTVLGISIDISAIQLSNNFCVRDPFFVQIGT